jgi:chemotaxis protein methyltransferase CheR
MPAHDQVPEDSHASGPSAGTFLPPGLPSGELSPEHFRRIARILYEACGIHLQDGKEQLVRSRLWKRMRAIGVASFEEYLALVQSPAGASEFSAMIDALTTNKTSFFRESQHFDFLRARLADRYASARRLRIWSAGCSSGQEPYSLAMSILEEWPYPEGRDIRILATDIAAPMLESARRGLYRPEHVRDVPPEILRKYFRETLGERESMMAVHERVRSLVAFARLNLLGRWPMRGSFDFIFCRNVMIYFDKDTQRRLISRFRGLLAPAGFLLVGHSESLTGRAEGFRYLQPAVYQKCDELLTGGGRP